MKKHLLGIILLASSTTSFSGTGLNCLEADKMEGNALEQCAMQSDRDLNDFYKQLINKVKEDKNGGEKLLRGSQKSWLKMRNMQCKLIELNAAGFELPVAKDRCEIKMTEIRAREFEDLLLGGKLQ